MKKIAIIGASYLQEPLIEKAKSMGLQTHVFAWKANDVGERSADFFYPISIIEKEQILEKCRLIGIDGICTIASDLAVVTVNYVADQLHLVSNSPACTLVSTNKHEMREAFRRNGDPSPNSVMVRSVADLADVSLEYPVIVKPVDRSGSRGIMKLDSPEGLTQAIQHAAEQSFSHEALVEEFAQGQEYSVEHVSWKGKHHFLAVTKKYTTGVPHFIETGHLEPAPLPEGLQKRICDVADHALDSLGIEYGASHTELKVSDRGEIKLIEIGGRMGGDAIGSSLVPLSTGIDFVKAVIDIALGREPDLTPVHGPQKAAVRFVFNQKDVDILEKLKQEHPEYLVKEDVRPVSGEVTDSSNRFGYYVFSGPLDAGLETYLDDLE